MRCKFLSSDGVCEGKYEGYACIGDYCTAVQEAKLCEYHEPTGDYCRKYSRFGCVGKHSCSTLEDYLEAVLEEEQA
jgi:hypothetical protein